MTPTYIARLLASFEEHRARISPSEQQPVFPFGQPPFRLVEPFSEHELEILRIVAAGLSNQEIADECYIAVSTVKSHLNNAFGKLNARSRIQAAVRAKELGLL